MIELTTTRATGVHESGLIPSIRGGIAVVAVAAVMACAHGGTQAKRWAWEPGSYEVRNTTSCYARISEINQSRTGSILLAELGPGQRTTVTLGADRRIYYVTKKESGPAAREYNYGDDCRGSGEVKITRVASTS